MPADRNQRDLVIIGVQRWLHGLEPGRDADTGGQTHYVVEPARALG